MFSVAVHRELVENRNIVNQRRVESLTKQVHPILRKNRNKKKTKQKKKPKFSHLLTDFSLFFFSSVDGHA